MMLEPTVSAHFGIPTSKRWVHDAGAYRPRRGLCGFRHTHLVRGGSVMFKPTTSLVRPSRFSISLRERWSVMLRPTSARRALRVDTMRGLKLGRCRAWL
jgi:hypothetical protein